VATLPIFLKLLRDDICESCLTPLTLAQVLWHDTRLGNTPLRLCSLAFRPFPVLHSHVRRRNVRRRCELIGLNGSTLYYEPVQASPKDLQLTRLIDNQYETPFYGSRRTGTVASRAAI